MNDSAGGLPSKAGDADRAKIVMSSYLKWLLLLVTGVMTSIYCQPVGI